MCRFHRLPCAYLRTNSTRRLFALPVAVLFVSTGLVAPKPAVVSRPASMLNCDTRMFFTASARRLERSMLCDGLPVASPADGHAHLF
jgi:hypothetical protein